MSKIPEAEVVLSQGEITALKKAIYYLKFECEETESVIFCGSPLINSAFDKLVASSDIEWDDDFYNRKNQSAERHMLEKLNEKRRYEGRSEIEDMESFEHAATYMHPFKV
ncbi:hypothetical protein [Pseudomonas entomophila]|uniref:Uncharacterized protein n=2 Tax=Pseudomonas entomophila TaxID=312306 RepID=Q1I517_PSEE4|nr:hypothetical protein [Pseudomonas entomophila]WMW07017.1 hypothetical protein RAH46_06685 [Pseudomonas entomophila]CAK17269.1 hypothetical protein PSEEN4591 [Pseudomonas entomophila L48]